MRTKDAPLYNLTDFSVVQSVLTHLLPMHPFSTPWKQGVEKRCIVNKWVKKKHFVPAIIKSI